MKKIQEELQNLLTLLKIEKEEDLLQYSQRMQSASPVQRRKEGVCWYPVILERTAYDAGERLLVKILRPKEHKESHLFQSGKLVSLFSNQGNDFDEESASGVVNYVREHEMLITLNSDEVPEWIHRGKLGVQLLFDENSYREMESALKYLIKTEDERLQQLKHILLGETEAVFDNKNHIELKELNQSQNEALNLVLNARDIAIVHGPPGTGKTTTLVGAISETLKEEKQVLVCAPSNSAIDLLAEKLGNAGINVLRIGHPARVTQEILGQTLDYRITQHSSYRDLKAVRRQADEYRNMGHKYKRNFGTREREQRKLLLTEAKKLREEAEHLAFYITTDILSKAQVIATTLVGAANYVLKGMRFPTVFIDEASQALEPATWIPVLKSGRIVLAGDHWQLPPTVKSIDAARAGLSETLFEKAVKRNKADKMLNEQYRMNTIIMDFSNRYFYKNELRANRRVSDWKILEDDRVMEFIDTAGCGFFEQTEEETRSSFNPEEAGLIRTHLVNYMQKVENNGKLESVTDIGIISPYKAQVTVLQEMILESKIFSDEINDKITINTVDSFQGQERDIIYISLVRSNDKGEIGFLSDERRMNVAMTRARKKLVIVGDSATICSHPFYDRLFNHVNETGNYRSAYELLY